MKIDLHVVKHGIRTCLSSAERGTFLITRRFIRGRGVLAASHTLSLYLIPRHSRVGLFRYNKQGVVSSLMVYTSNVDDVFDKIN